MARSNFHQLWDAATFFVDRFPLTPQGKVQKFKLREKAIAELGLKQG